MFVWGEMPGSKDIQVWINGQRHLRCVCADDEAGMAEVGFRPGVDSYNEAAVSTYTVHGRIEIRDGRPDWLKAQTAFVEQAKGQVGIQGRFRIPKGRLDEGTR